MSEAYIIFDPKVVTFVDPAGDDPAAGTLVPQPAQAQMLTAHIIAISKDGAVRLGVERVLKDGSSALMHGFREETDRTVAVAEAAAGKLVLRLSTPW